MGFFSLAHGPHDIWEIGLSFVGSEEVHRLGFELFNIVVEDVFFHGVDAKFDVDFPVDVVDVEVEGLLLLMRDLVEEIDSFYALAEPLFAEEVFIFVYYAYFLVFLQTLTLTVDFPGYHSQGTSQPFLQLGGQFLSFMLEQLT